VPATVASIRVSELFPHPPARVWRALTEPAQSARWWAAGDVRAVVGHRFTMDMGAAGQQPCEVLAVQPLRLLSYAFAPDTLHTAMTWRLDAEAGGTRLVLEHAGFDLDDAVALRAYEGMRKGWPGLLGRLGEFLAMTFPG
jgi:uncharacterized protein YndB with AHSA1/START domain